MRQKENLCRHEKMLKTNNNNEKKKASCGCENHDDWRGFARSVVAQDTNMSRSCGLLRRISLICSGCIEASPARSLGDIDCDSELPPPLEDDSEIEIAGVSLDEELEPPCWLSA